MSAQIKLRRDTSANWTTVNPILATGEPGLETDTLKLKYGDGLTRWNALSYPIINFPTNVASANSASSIIGGSSNQLLYQSAPGITAFIPAPNIPGFLQWTGSSYVWGSSSTVAAAGTLTGSTIAATVTTAAGLTTIGTSGVLTTLAGNISVTGSSALTGTVTLNSVSGTTTVTGTSTFNNQLTVSTGGITVSAGGITVSSGGLTVSNGGVSVTTGGITVAAGGAAINGGGLTVTGATTITGATNVVGTFKIKGYDFKGIVLALAAAMA
jgi:hypothetical protein